MADGELSDNSALSGSAERRSAGFPSPASDYIELRLDLNTLLIKHREATFFLRVEGDSMLGAGIHSGDLIIVDRSLKAQHKRVVVAVLDGELIIRRLLIDDDGYTLASENVDFPAMKIGGDANFEIWGTVTSVIHQL
ncbi:translesion error-prone DNA polymerase V autoproteolytic subunit [soil metagenome]